MVFKFMFSSMTLKNRKGLTLILILTKISDNEKFNFAVSNHSFIVFL
jgi:hypothetical protein